MDLTSYLLGKKSSGGGSNLQVKNVSVLSNGESSVNPDTGYDGMSKVNLSINVEPYLESEIVTITENGTQEILPPEGADGLYGVQIITNVSGGRIEQKNVNFYDYEGKLLNSYSSDEIEEWDSLPEGPTHEDMEFQQWNWKLQDIKNYMYNHDAEEMPNLAVGETCCTDDDTTRIYINLSSGLLSPTLGLYTTGTVEIDWGDDTNIETITANGNNTIKEVTHTYEYDGRYKITITPTNTLYLKGTNYASDLVKNNTTIYGTSSSPGIGYRACVEKIQLGADVIISTYGLAGLCMETINLPAGCMTDTGESAFENDYLKFLVLPRGVTTINSRAFQNCKKLKIVVLPKEVTSINMSAFSKSGIEFISLPDQISSFNGNFNECYSLEKITLPANGTLPSSYGFCYTSLKNITIPSNCTAIGQHSFDYIHRIKEITVPSGVKSISSNLFTGMRGLNKVVFLGAVTSIGTEAFKSCYSLLTVDLTYCTSVPTVASNSFNDANSNYRIIVPHSLYDAWIATSSWSSYTSHIVDEENI